MPRRIPSQERARETVNIVFEGAIRELAQGNPEAVNVNRIAEAAGVSIGSIYQYFPSKQALLTSMIEYFMRRRFNAIVGMIQAIEGEEARSGAQLPLEEVMRRLVAGTAGFKRRALSTEVAIIAWFVRVGSLTTLTQLDAEFTEKFAEGLRALQRPPARIRPVDPRLAARVLLQSVRAVLVTAVLQEPTLFDGDALVEELTLLAVRYLRPE